MFLTAQKVPQRSSPLDAYCGSTLQPFFRSAKCAADSGEVLSLMHLSSDSPKSSLELLAEWPIYLAVLNRYYAPMKITASRLYKIPPRWVFLEVQTDEGIVGWGEPAVEGRADTVITAVKELEPIFIGSDPTKINDLWQQMYVSAFYRGGPVLMSAIAGVDQALWDILGKSLNKPVIDLLGGSVRERMKAYCWVGGDDPSDEITQIETAVNLGRDTFKLNGCGRLKLIDSLPRSMYELQLA